MALQHLRSSTANKRPTPASMADGQLALNSAGASPGLFFKTSTGGLVKVGPVHVGTTAPNATPATGGQAGNTVGEQWLDTTGGTYVFKVWDGTAWRSETGTFVDVNGDTMTGALGIIAGTAAAPGLFISGDTNTGIYSPGGDQVAISTGGTGRLFINSAGSVGIGTATPGAPLEVSGSAAFRTDSDVRLTIGSSGTIGSNDSNFIRAATDQVIYNAATSSGRHSWELAGSEKARIDSSGRLGVGTSNPQTLLNLASATGTASPTPTTLRIQTTSSATDWSTSLPWGRLDFFSSDTSNSGPKTHAAIDVTAAGVAGGVSNLSLKTNDASGNLNSVLTATYDGKVGIGTTSPSVPLHVFAGAVNSDVAIFTGGNLTRGLKISTFLSTNSDAGVRYNAQNAGGTHAWDVNGAEVARIDSSGRLLVGTSTARANFQNSTGTAALQVEGTTQATSVFSVTRNSATSAPIIRLARSAGTTIGSNTILTSADPEIGRINFEGNDGSEFVIGAQISAEVDGTPGANDMPGRLMFSTTADGESSPTERMRIDSSGNVGIGTTSPEYKLDSRGSINVSGSIFRRSADNATFSITNRAAQPLTFGTNDTERARIDSSGRLLVGTSSSSATATAIFQSNSLGTEPGIVYISSDATNPADGIALGLLRFSAANHSAAAQIEVERDGGTWTAGSSQPTRLIFSTTADSASSPTERMRISQDGAVDIGENPGTQPSSTSRGFRVSSDAHTLISRNVGSLLQVVQVWGSGGEARIKGDGDLENTNNSYSGISDVKLKENIADANSQWNDLKALQVRKYNFKAETGYNTHTQIGLIAQEVELVSPGLVGESIDEETGEPTKSVNYSVLYMKAVKALQEAMERIEVLEAKVNALEGN